MLSPLRFEVTMSKKKIKKAGRGKSKGSGFERDCARACDVWWKVESGTFWRTTNSGGWKEPGDIAPRLRQSKPATWWPFVMECKFYKAIEIWQLADPKIKHAKLREWWQQVLRERDQALASGRSTKEVIPLLVFKQNASQKFVMFDLSYFPKVIADVYDGAFFLGISSHIFLPSSTAPPWTALYIATWDAFVQFFPKEYMYTILEKPMS